MPICIFISFFFFVSKRKNGKTQSVGSDGIIQNGGHEKGKKKNVKKNEEEKSFLSIVTSLTGQLRRDR